MSQTNINMPRLPRSATSAKFSPIGWKTFSVGFQAAGSKTKPPTATQKPLGSAAIPCRVRS